ncbi:MAG: hypothetical protein RDU89_10350 [bacterium]|nr:hypothetical protein [bacterium]
MTCRGFRIPVVLAVVVATLAVLLSGSYLYRRETELVPLVRRSAGIEGVSDVSIRWMSLSGHPRGDRGIDHDCGTW